jgi:hypothetical protein
MSTRERWIVYPLLFLALGTAIKPKLVPAERVICRNLEVVDDELQPRIRLSTAASDDGEIRIINRGSKAVVLLKSGAATQAGIIETFNSHGQVQTAMMSSGSGGEGEIRINNRGGNPVVMLKADAATQAGLIETLNDDGRPQTAMMSSATGGEVAAFDLGVRNSVAIGHRDGRFGLLHFDFESKTSTFVPIAKLATLVRFFP